MTKNTNESKKNILYIKYIYINSTNKCKQNL